MDWYKVCEANELQVGDVVKAEVAGHEIALFHLNDGFYATQDLCTHAVASLADGYVEDDMVECPLHAAKFCIRTGAAKCLPASVPLKIYPIRLQNTDVYVGVGEQEEVAQ